MGGGGPDIVNIGSQEELDQFNQFRGVSPFPALDAKEGEDFILNIAPGLMRVEDINPEIARELDVLRGLRTQAEALPGEVTGTAREAAGFQAGALGLGGAVGRGAVGEAGLEAGLEAEIRGLQIQQQLGSAIAGGIVQAQSQFGQFQGQQLQAATAESLAEAQALAGISGNLGTGIGTLAGSGAFDSLFGGSPDGVDPGVGSSGIPTTGGFQSGFSSGIDNALNFDPSQFGGP